MPSLERSTARLLLRRVSLDDLAAFVALETALRAREAPPRPPPAAADSARYLASFASVWERGDLGYWTILTENRIVGFGGVAPARWRERECWNLYYRVTPEAWGRGIATEMAREAVTVAAEVHPTWSVLVRTRPDNTPAIRVAERAGLLRQPPHPDDDGYAVLLLTR